MRISDWSSDVCSSDLALQDPWPLQARLSTSAIGVGADSPLCANRYVSRLPVNSGAKSKNAKDKDSAGKEDAADCTLDIETTLAGTLDDLKLAVNGAGQGMRLDVAANLAPRAAFQLKDATSALQLADGSQLESGLVWSSEAPTAAPP